MTSTVDLAAAIERMIDEKVAALERRTVTPSGLRIAKDMTVEQLAAAAKISVNQLRRYEAGLVDNLQHTSVERRISRIAHALDISFSMYRAAVERMRD